MQHLADQVVVCEAGASQPFVALEHLDSRAGALVVGVELPVREPDATSMVSFKPGDVLFGKLRPYLAKSWRADRHGLSSSELIVMRPKKDTDSRWLGYLAQSDLLVEWSVATSEGVKMPRTSWEKLRLLEVPRSSQDALPRIADYLDAETARIDALVSARRSQIALVGHRVRASIDAEFENAPERRRLKHLLAAPLQYGASEAAEADDPSWPRYVRTTDIDAEGGLRPDTFRSLPPPVARTYLLREGDILLTRSGATVGKSMLWRAGWGDACFAGYLIRARPDRSKVLPEYLAYFLRSTRYWDEIRVAAIQATIQNVSAERYGEMPVPMTNLGAQRVIVDRLNRVVERAARQARLMQRQIDLLRERRLALITSAATGTLQIPGVAA